MKSGLATASSKRFCVAFAATFCIRAWECFSETEDYPLARRDWLNKACCFVVSHLLPDVVWTFVNSGFDSPGIYMDFRSFGLAEPLVRAVAKQGYSVPTPIQQKGIPAVLSGRDVVGIAQTGTGKTAAFALPLLHQMHQHMERSRSSHEPRQTKVLVLASTRELALQIQESFEVYGAFAHVKIVTIYGGVGQQPQVKALRAGADIIVATPGRLLDLMKQGFVRLEGMKTLVLDEADRMLDMGFFPAIRRILERIPRQRQTLMFSATMKPEIRELADTMLHEPVSISIEPRQKTTDLVEQSVCFVPQKAKTRVLIELINRLNPSRAIVFSRTKHGADRIVRHMTAAGLKAEAIHANKSQNRRLRTLEEFRSSSPPILVATDIAARGIDVDLVSHVFNHDMPTEEETYVHRIGRSGRAGATGVAVSLCDPEERRMLRSIEKLIGQSISIDDLEGIEIPDTPMESDSRVDHRSAGRGRRNDGGGRRGDAGARRGEPGRGSDRRHREIRSSDEDRTPREGRSSESAATESGAWRFNGHEARRKEQGPRRSARTDSRPSSGSRPAAAGRASDSSVHGSRTSGGDRSSARPERRDRPERGVDRNRPPGPSRSSEFGDGIFADDRRGHAERRESNGPRDSHRQRETRGPSERRMDVGRSSGPRAAHSGSGEQSGRRENASGESFGAPRRRRRRRPVKSRD